MESILEYVSWCRKENRKPCEAKNIFDFQKLKLCRNETA